MDVAYTAWDRRGRSAAPLCARDGDHQWIHVDVEQAKVQSPFGTTIAHGKLTLSIIDGLREQISTAKRSIWSRSPSASTWAGTASA